MAGQPGCLLRETMPKAWMGTSAFAVAADLKMDLSRREHPCRHGVADIRVGFKIECLIDQDPMRQAAASLSMFHIMIESTGESSVLHGLRDVQVGINIPLFVKRYEASVPATGHRHGLNVGGYRAIGFAEEPMIE